MSDPASYSNFGKITPTHYAFEWDINFETEQINGLVKVDLSAVQDTNEVILDGRELTIDSVTRGDTSLKFDIEADEVLGQKIGITLNDFLKAGETTSITIAYSTAPSARALQFLSKEQTTDKQAPYLFSQCQAIHARSILPCMDTPSAKATYEAKVSIPTGLKCLMSGIGGMVASDDAKSHFVYKQNIPIPSYLIAIVVGALEKRDISSRCAVWSEPSMADACLWEFEETEKFLKTAEDLAGPYVWGRYDMVVLPGTFPFGGMENPCLTFITPTLLAGDRSLVNVVAHEIAHSWTGNLVTNANWEHFWLNEGFTVFLERKILGRLRGEKERQFASERGYDESLVNTVTKVFGPTHEYTKLIQNQKGIDPDDAFSSVPYEKGSALLFTLDQMLEDSIRFEEFLRSYIAKHAKKNVTTDVWKSELYSFFNDKKNVLDGLDWNKWLHEPGLPPRPKYDSSLSDACRTLAMKWTSANIPESTDEFASMSSDRKVTVIDIIRQSGKFDKDRMSVLTDRYGLSDAKNCELRFSWLMLGIEIKWEPVIAPALSFVLNIGRLKYCKPIYKALFSWPLSSAQAVEQFRKYTPFMHPITASVIGKLLPK